MWWISKEQEMVLGCICDIFSLGIIIGGSGIVDFLLWSWGTGYCM
jgi:hypothetical protein